MGLFPVLEVPIGEENRGLGVGHWRGYLPLWVQKSFGDWTTYGGGGYWINHGNGTIDRDNWYFGYSAGSPTSWRSDWLGLQR
jgi:hypothetical protein